VIITLLTDFGLGDNFVGVMKGVILGINPKTEIVDISHNISPGDTIQAAFLLKSSYLYFPQDAIHLVVVDPGVGTERKIIIAKTEKYYFIGPDNGVLSLALKSEEKIIGIVSVTNQKFFLKPVSSTFHGRDIFAPVAAYLSLGRDIRDFGKLQPDYNLIKFPQPKIIASQAESVKGGGKKSLQGEIIYIDRFGNLITNIQEDNFRKFAGKRNFLIRLKGKSINKINTSYLETQKDKPLAIFGSSGNLELSVISMLKRVTALKFFFSSLLLYLQTSILR
jgi:hypothetical protein